MTGNGLEWIIRIEYNNWSVCKPSESLKTKMFYCFNFSVLLFYVQISDQYYWKKLLCTKTSRHL